MVSVRFDTFTRIFKMFIQKNKSFVVTTGLHLTYSEIAFVHKKYLILEIVTTTDMEIFLSMEKGSALWCDFQLYLGLQ